jgi:hypothetical protein
MAPPGKKATGNKPKPKPKPVVKANAKVKATAKATAKDLEAAAKTLLKLSKTLKK